MIRDAIPSCQYYASIKYSWAACCTYEGPKYFLYFYSKFDDY